MNDAERASRLERIIANLPPRIKALPQELQTAYVRLLTVKKHQAEARVAERARQEAGPEVPADLEPSDR